ncbi:hypothetical protein GQ44DRAFT_722541 [Phaeosphaeriaceae sp. PMI808]|nr:hypothetical protein GQ44DRAFT_722541 [Phaeosphaeriaceae sp. PMI808]
MAPLVQATYLSARLALRESAPGPCRVDQATTGQCKAPTLPSSSTLTHSSHPTRMEVPSIPQDSNERVQEWLLYTSNPLRLLPHLSAQNHPLLPSPPPSNATPRKRKFNDAFPANNAISIPRPTRSEAGSQSNVTELTKKTNFTINPKQKGVIRSPSPA